MYKAYLHTTVGTEIVAIKTVKGVWTVCNLCPPHIQYYDICMSTIHTTMPVQSISVFMFCFWLCLLPCLRVKCTQELIW